MIIDTIQQRIKRDEKNSIYNVGALSSMKGKTGKYFAKALLPFLVTVGANVYNANKSNATYAAQATKQQSVTGGMTILNLAGLPDKGANVAEIIKGINDPNISGILSTVSDDEVKVLCQTLKREAVLVNKGEYVTVVSPKEPLSKSFKVGELTTITSKDIPVQKNIELKKEAKDALIKMVKYVNSYKRPNGTNYKLVAVSGYRSFSYQTSLYDRKVKSVLSANLKLSDAQAESQAAKIVAPPYESEHALGTTVDFSTGVQINKGGDILTNAMADTAEYALMVKEGWKFGWINSLQPGKEHLTGRMTETWHWMFVDRPHAEVMWQNHWIPVEYRDYMRQKRNVIFESSTGSVYWLSYDGKIGRTSASELKAK